MSSEIDRHDAIHAMLPYFEPHQRNEPARHVAARLYDAGFRLAAAQPSREDIYRAIFDLMNERGEDDEGIGASDITDAVMAVLSGQGGE